MTTIGLGFDDDLMYETRQSEAMLPRKFSGTHALREAAKTHSDRVRLASSSHVPQTTKKYGKTKLNEASLAEVLRGHVSNHAKEPFDIYAGKHAIEVKTIVESGHDRITMHPSSLKTKLRAAKKGGFVPHTVVFDTRKGKEAVYYREGLGSFRLAQMKRLPGIEAIREALGIEHSSEGGPGSGPRASELTSHDFPQRTGDDANKKYEYLDKKKPIKIDFLGGKDLPPEAEARESGLREHGGDGTILHPLDSNEYIPMHEGGSGSGNFKHEGRPGEVGGSGAGGGGGKDKPSVHGIFQNVPEKKKRAPNRPMGEKYGLAGQVGHGYKAKIARRLFNKPYQGLEKHEKEQVRAELRNRGIVRPKGTTAANADEKELLTGKVISKEKLHEGGANTSYKITLEGGAQGVFKPDAEVYKHGKEALRHNVSVGYDVERETAAWDVAKLVGMEDIVSPTVERTIEGQRGSFQRFWDGKVANSLGRDERYDGSEDLHRAAAFDYVTGNEDRNVGNWLVGHGRLQLIDHGLCFPDTGGYGDGGADRHHLLLHKVMVEESSHPMSPMEAAKPFVEKKDEILKALKDKGLPEGAITRVGKRIDAMSKTEKWQDLPVKKRAWG